MKLDELNAFREELFTAIARAYRAFACAGNVPTSEFVVLGVVCQTYLAACKEYEFTSPPLPERGVMENIERALFALTPSQPGNLLPEADIENAREYLLKALQDGGAE